MISYQFCSLKIISMCSLSRKINAYIFLYTYWKYFIIHPKIMATGIMIRIFCIKYVFAIRYREILFYFCFMTIMKKGERTICLSFQGTEHYMTYHLIILCIFSFVILKLTLLRTFWRRFAVMELSYFIKRDINTPCKYFVVWQDLCLDVCSWYSKELSS